MKNKRIIIYAMAAMTLISACSSDNKKDNTEGASNVKAVDKVSEIAEVETIELQPSEFSHNIVSNGRIRAARSVDLFFRNPDLISDVAVHNGQRVGAGQLLARLDTYKLNSKLKQQQASIEKAKLEMKDVLIGQGYDTDNMKEVPAEVMKLARVKSGLESLEASCAEIRRDLEESMLRAPYAGVVANVMAKSHGMASSSDPVCRIIDDSRMEVEFPVLESELPLISTGDNVKISPFSGGESHEGKVARINPIVDDNGHVTISATVTGLSRLLDGMNVRVNIQRAVGKRLVVPKSAVVTRSGRQVVFTSENGKAIWNYVTTGLENLDSYVIDEGLSAGQSVIVKGNEDLAHEAPVKVVGSR